jgi:SnoaL-like protein
MADAMTQLMKSNLHLVFGERDPAARLAVVNRIYTEDVTFADAEGVLTGREALHRKAQELLDGAPGFVFTEAGPVYQAQDLGCLAWNFGPAGQQPVVSGMDIAIVRDGRIASLHTILTTS